MQFIYDIKILDFNSAYEKYSNLISNNPEIKEEYGFINIMKQEIKLSKDLINLFVFCVLNVKMKKLAMNSELDDRSSEEIKTIELKAKLLV